MNERHHGGPPTLGTPAGVRGNTNALKHGFYSTRFSPSASPNQDGLENAGTLNLSAEIALLRLSIRRVVELTPPDQDLDSARETLRLLCLASTAISRLVRAHYFVKVDENNEMQDEIGQIVAEMRAEMALRNGTKPAPGSNPPPFREGPGVGSPHPGQAQDDPDLPSPPSRSALPKGSRDAPPPRPPEGERAPAGVTPGVGSPGPGPGALAKKPHKHHTRATPPVPLSPDLVAPRGT